MPISLILSYASRNNLKPYTPRNACTYFEFGKNKRVLPAFFPPNNGLKLPADDMLNFKSSNNFAALEFEEFFDLDAI